jgi:molecular chaperone GrpE
MTTKKSKKTKKKFPDKIKDNIEKKCRKFEEEIKQMKLEIKEKEDLLLRSIADYQNYRKRKEKEFNSNETEIKKKYLSELIDLKELLHNAYIDKNPKKGLKLIIKNLENFLESEQIKYIDCIGKTFDHKIHHAVTTVKKNDCKEETILEEVKKGYLIKDDLLRPSHVIVSKKK